MFDDAPASPLEAPTAASTDEMSNVSASGVETPPKPVVHIWTIQMSHWRKARDQKIALLDTTAKSGVQAFAPDYTVVMDYKRGEVSEEDYTQIYHDRMAYSLTRFPDKWAQLKTKDRIALACYCRPGEFCHRKLFAVLAKDYLEKQGFEVHLEGELR